MNVFRTSRLFAALIALASLLFMQLAVAAHICPQQAGVHASIAADVAAIQQSADCLEGAEALPNLCHAQAQADLQSLDKPQLPALSFVIGAAMLHQAGRPDLKPARRDVLSLTRATEPPVAIRNCCFRI